MSRIKSTFRAIEKEIEFCYFNCMNIKFSSRGNGACPFCRKKGKCVVLNKIQGAVKDIRNSDAAGMEIVIYSCPNFEEIF